MDHGFLENEVGDDDHGCAEYWRRMADRLQAEVIRLREEVAELRSPKTIVHRGVRNGVLVEQSIVRIPEETWEREVEQFPHLASWEWMAASGVMFLFSPTLVASSDVALADSPVAGQN